MSKVNKSATVKGSKSKSNGERKASESKPEAPAAPKGRKGKLPVETQECGGGKYRYTVFGLPVTSILRWYGSKGRMPREVHAALTAAGLTNLSPTTVGIQVAAGRHGGNCNGRGELPELTKEQERTLLAALES